MDYLLAVLRVEPRNKRIRYRTGVCLQEIGRQARALKYLREAAEGEGALPEAAAGNRGRAAPVFQKVVALGRESPTGQRARRLLQAIGSP